MDGENTPLIGAHGYCSQEMVNLLLTGRAVSNTFDGSIKLSENGIFRASDVEKILGLLSNYCRIIKGFKHKIYYIRKDSICLFPIFEPWCISRIRKMVRHCYY